MRQLGNLPIAAGGGWCQAVIMVPSQNEPTILATRRLYSPLKFCAVCPSVAVFRARWLHDVATQTRLLIFFAGSGQSVCLHRTRDGLAQVYLRTLACHCFAPGLCATGHDS